jgi:general secretion pathway protein F
MPVYAWKGLNNAGKAVGGTKDADGPKNLRQNLRKDGIFVTEHKEVLGGAAGRPGGGVKVASGEKVPFFKREIDLGGLLQSVRPQDVAVLTRQLATLLKAGIPLAEALAALGDQADNKKLAMVLVEVREKVTQGTSLADTFAAYPKIFPDLYVNMVRSGEAAGNLDAVLLRLADFMDSQNALRAKVVGALTYPILMMVLGSIVMGILMVVVVPKITSVFDDLNQGLPWNTELLIFVSGVVGTFWWLLIPAAIFGYVSVKRWGRRPAGRAFFDRLKLRIWLIGPLVRFIAVARFARTLATMLAAGVPVLNALEIVKKVLNNTVLEKVIEEARDAIREGESIAATLKKSGQFPSMMCHMVAVGERSGQLETMLENVAGAYERDVEVQVNRMTTILSPMMIVVMAVGVGFIVFSVITPIMDMQQLIQ